MQQFQTPQTPQTPQQQPWAQPLPATGRMGLSHPWANAAHTYVAPLLLLPGRIRGKLSPYREGWICMVPEGLLLAGKAVPSGSGTFLKQAGVFFLFGSLLGSLIAEKVLIKPRQDPLPWECIEEIVLMSRKGRLCLVYHLPDAPDKPLSLGLRLAPAPLFNEFAQAATHYLGPEKVHEGKIGPPSTPAQIILAVVVILVIVIAIIAAGLSDK